jgi:hypothetical protein
VEPTPVTVEPETPVAPVEPTPVAVEPEAPVAPVEPTPVTVEPETPVAPVEPTPVTVEPEAPVEPMAPAVPVVPMPCELAFSGLTAAAETARVRELVAAQAVGGEVTVSTDAAGQVVMSFTLSDLSALPALSEAIRTRAGATPQPAFEELSRKLSVSFRTASLHGAVTMTVHFTVTPGSQLFVSLSPGAEAQVDPANLSAAGDATVTVQLPRGERSVYARSVLGAVEKCICLDVLTGDATDITREQYQTHQ